ncbi:PqqD family protein [Cohnella cholangitidis]|uniref:PqqD family protein n=1 Tax=Cohnella cholangitidis TaxID=2598458 RepID=A0A7G5C205_9BACL|nr:PqqD family protein [Cohnella cholangitidis]QMV43239.1 PqqD family protein [Cohnella cholangitidis]
MWKCANHTEAVEMDGEWIVLDAEKYLITKLNEVGGWIYARIQAGDGLDRLAQAMIDEYGISEEQARNDILVFAAQLIDCGLIENVA